MKRKKYETLIKDKTSKNKFFPTPHLLLLIYLFIHFEFGNIINDYYQLYWENLSYKTYFTLGYRSDIISFLWRIHKTKLLPQCKLIYI